MCCSQKYFGVLNGIDTLSWDPTCDMALPAPYSNDFLVGKGLCKRYIQAGLGLEVDPNKPLVVCITRLVPQKGIHLIAQSIRTTHERGGQFVLLGTGHSDADFVQMQQGEFYGSRQVKILLQYNDTLSRLLYGGSDVTVVPSMFEPCGLTQMIAMRYGSIPLVRNTGGLADTVKDVGKDPTQGNGFVFDGTGEKDVEACVIRALDLYFEDQAKWEELQMRNMRIDVSWNAAAREYASLYEGLWQTQEL